MPVEANIALLNGARYQLVSDSMLPQGLRAWSRLKRQSEPSDPGVQRVAQWRLSGPIGLSREDVAGGPLAVDYTQNMDTLYENMLLPGPARNAIDVTADHSPPADAPYDGFAYDEAPYDGGTSSYLGTAVAYIDEDRGSLFFHDGALSTQVEPSGMTAVQTKTHGAAVRGAVMWRNKGYLGLGGNSIMQRRATVSSTASTYENVSSFYAGSLVVGPDRIWMVDPEDSTESTLRYSLDALATRSNAFPIGDPGIPSTGLGTYGRSATVGSELGAYGFNELGQPTRVLESLRGQRSVLNGEWITTLWGWTYITTSIGLKATIPGQVETPAGPGADRRYEGPNGRVTAIWPYKDALFSASLTADGDAYVYRGEFDDGRYGGNTSSTGRPAWFPFCYLSSVEVGVLFSTALRTNPTLLVGESGEASYWTLSELDRDIDDPLYRYHTGTGTWFGTTMMRNPNLHKNARYFTYLAENVDSSNKFQIAISVDDGSYVNIGGEITSTGHDKRYPATGGVPLTTVNGHFYKPKITCTSASTTVAPTLRGTLDMIYDERPAMITQHTFIVELGATQKGYDAANADYTALTNLLAEHGAGAASPFAFQIPGETNTVYGLMVDVSDVTDMKPDAIQRAQVTVQEWPTS